MKFALSTASAFPVRLPSVHLHLYWHANSDADPSNLWLRNLMHKSVSAAVSKLKKVSG